MNSSYGRSFLGLVLVGCVLSACQTAPAPSAAPDPLAEFEAGLPLGVPLPASAVRTLYFGNTHYWVRSADDVSGFDFIETTGAVRVHRDGQPGVANTGQARVEDNRICFLFPASDNCFTVVRLGTSYGMYRDGVLRLTARFVSGNPERI